MTPLHPRPARHRARPLTVAVALVLLAPGLAVSAPLTRDQQDCVLETARNAGEIARSVTKNSGKCLSAFDRGNIDDPDGCAGALGAPADPVAQTIAKAQERDAGRCSGDGLPPYGYGGATIATWNAVRAGYAVPETLFGAPLADSRPFAPGGAEAKSYGRCRKKVLKRVAGLHREAGVVFERCLRTVIDQDSVESAAALADACVADDGTGVIDTKGKIAKRAEKLERDAGKVCVDKGLDLALAFPAAPCTDAGAAAFTACTEERLRCNWCVATAAVHDLPLDCDVFDNGLADASCTDEAVASTTTTSMVTTTTVTTTTLDTFDALFLGNSYTGANSLSSLVAGFAAADGRMVDEQSRNPGGARFSTHAESGTSQNLIRSRAWDAIVLQNQSQVPGWRPNDVRALSLPYAQALASIAREGGRDPLLLYFVTWGRRDGDGDNCDYYPLVCTFEGHTDALQEGYEIYRDETGGELATAGWAWANVRADPDVPFDPTDLWKSDGSHPSLSGSFLTAAVIFAKLFDAPVRDVPYTAGLDDGDAAYLRDLAERTVAEGLIDFGARIGTSVTRYGRGRGHHRSAGP